MRRARRTSTLLPALAALLLPVPARAACEDGSWFCEEPGAEKPPGPPAAPARPAPLEEEAESEDEEEGDEEGDETGEGRAWPPKVYDPPRFGLKKATPSRHKKRHRTELGFNSHLSLAYLGNSPHQDSDAFMGGIGGSFRIRPVRVVAFDAGLELIGGDDWNGDERFEAALLANALVFFNPRSRFQLYALAGFGVSRAFIEREVAPGDFRDRQESYAGAQLGIGAEWRVARKTALSMDFLGFIRGRGDRHRNDPEFVDPKTHQATDVSAGGLFRLGASFYF